MDFFEEDWEEGMAIADSFAEILKVVVMNLTSSHRTAQSSEMWSDGE